MQISIRSAASLMQIISTAFEDTGRSGKPERLFFFPEGRTYSPPARRAGGGIPPSSGTRALCEPSTGCFSRGQPMPQRIPAVIGCAAGRPVVAPVRRFAANRCPLPGQPANRLRKPAATKEDSLREPDASALSQLWTDASPHRPFSFDCAKRNKNAPCREPERK